MMSDVKAVSDFSINSPKRSDYLKTNIVQIFPKEKYTKLIDPCRTRWIKRPVALDRFQELYEAIMVTLEKTYIKTLEVVIRDGMKTRKRMRVPYSIHAQILALLPLL